MNLEGKCAIITGGAAGIGKCAVENMVKRGVNVVFGDTNFSLGQALEAELNNGKERVKFCECDVRNTDQLKNLFDTATQFFGGAQIVINNAGIFPLEHLGNSVEFIAPIVDINLTGVISGTSLAILHFNQQTQHQEFNILNISSVAAIDHPPSRSVYAATKAGVLHFSQTMGYLKKFNIRVNCILPDITDTKLLNSAIGEDEAVRRAVEAALPLLPPQKIVDGMFSILESRDLAGEALVVSPRGNRLLAKL